MGDRYTTSPGSVFGGAREARNRCHDFSTAAVWPWDGTPHEQVCITGHEEDLYQMKPVKCAALEKQPISPVREAPRLLPSERRRLQKERKAAEKRALEEARAAAEAAAVAEADAVLERQSARPDATSAMLTSVLLKRGGTACQM